MYISVATCVFLPLIGGTNIRRKQTTTDRAPMSASFSVTAPGGGVAGGREKKQLAMATGHPSSEGGKDRKRSKTRVAAEAVALLFHKDVLVDGDRCSVLLRMPGSQELLMPAEVRCSSSVPAPKGGVQVSWPSVV